MIPCPHPNVCGVTQHNEGSESFRQCLRNGIRANKKSRSDYGSVSVLPSRNNSSDVDERTFSDDWEVRAQVARDNDLANSDELRYLCTDDDSRVRAEVAKCCGSMPDVSEQLASDPNGEVRYRLAQNTSYATIISKLTQDSNSEVIDAAWNNLSRRIGNCRGFVQNSPEDIYSFAIDYIYTGDENAVDLFLESDDERLASAAREMELFNKIQANPNVAWTDIERRYPLEYNDLCEHELELVCSQGKRVNREGELVDFQIFAEKHHIQT